MYVIFSIDKVHIYMFFITYVNKDTNVDMMKQHIESNSITVANLTIKEGDDYN